MQDLDTQQSQSGTGDPEDLEITPSENFNAGIVRNNVSCPPILQLKMS